MSSKCAIKLIGEICRAEIIDDHLRVTVSIGEQSTFFDVPVFQAQAKNIYRLCHALGIKQLKDVKQFVGMLICLHVVQPQVAEGLIPQLVVVDFQGVI